MLIGIPMRWPSVVENAVRSYMLVIVRFWIVTWSNPAPKCVGIDLIGLGRAIVRAFDQTIGAAVDDEEALGVNIQGAGSCPMGRTELGPGLKQNGDDASRSPAGLNGQGGRDRPDQMHRIPGADLARTRAPIAGGVEPCSRMSVGRGRSSVGALGGLGDVDVLGAN